MNDDFSLLLKPEYGWLLELCFERPRSVGEVAAATGWSPNSSFARVRQLVRRGVLRAVREERRAGKPVKFYAPTQERFDIPFAQTPFATYQDFLLERMNRPLRPGLRAAYRRLDLADDALAYSLYFRAGILQASVRIQGLTEEEGRELYAQHGLIHRWVPLRLTPDNLTDFHRELEALTARYFRPFAPDEEANVTLGLFLLPH